MQVQFIPMMPTSRLLVVYMDVYELIRTIIHFESTCGALIAKKSTIRTVEISILEWRTMNHVMCQMM